VTMKNTQSFSGFQLTGSPRSTRRETEWIPFYGVACLDNWTVKIFTIERAEL
jgi:hypothetical protein